MSVKEDSLRVGDPGNRLVEKDERAFKLVAAHLLSVPLTLNLQYWAIVLGCGIHAKGMSSTLGSI